MIRILTGLLALILAANGLAMLFAGPWWYGVVPGVVATGPFNSHFVRDIGAAYLVTAGGLVAFSVKPREAWPALAVATAFLALHAVIHVCDALAGAAPLADFARDFAGVYLPALITLAITVRERP